jgi:hypothetical protein
MHQPRLGTPVIVADIVQQLPVLTGVVIGALASYLVSSATERAQWRRQQAARWDDKRVQVYADYGYSVKNVYIACLRIVENRGLNTKSVPTDPQVFGEFERLATERTAKWEPVLLQLCPAGGSLPAASPVLAAPGLPLMHAYASQFHRGRAPGSGLVRRAVPGSRRRQSGSDDR